MLYVGDFCKTIWRNFGLDLCSLVDLPPSAINLKMVKDIEKLSFAVGLNLSALKLVRRVTTHNSKQPGSLFQVSILVQNVRIRIDALIVVEDRHVRRRLRSDRNNHVKHLLGVGCHYM